jgi:cell fate regulator YaaT (PSP1 superfamily)
MTLTSEHHTQTATARVAGVRFHEVGKIYHFSYSHIPDLMVGDFVIVETARGVQLGQVMNLIEVDAESELRDYKPILRRATPTDLMSQKLWKAREVEALITCREKAAELGGFNGVKFVAAQYNFDGSLLTFLYTTEEKINTMRLRSVLQRSFRAKVELRQIGPRDVAKLLGGMGACGIPRCCSTFLTDFSPISIKMAKAQGISLNPTEITGMCGRLRCCLIYEYEQYVEARKQLPKRNKRVGTPHGEGKVIDVHPLRDAVTVLVNETQYLVSREDLIPLDELEALQAKAEAGCSKAETGGCDCGARAPALPDEEEEEETDLGDEQGIVADELPELEEAQDEADLSESSPSAPRPERSRRGRRRHGRGMHRRNRPHQERPDRHE